MAWSLKCQEKFTARIEIVTFVKTALELPRQIPLKTFSTKCSNDKTPL